MTIDHSLALPPDQYFQEETRKDLIVLHFSAGSTAEGAVSWWKSNKERVATAFLVGKGGKVYQAFDPKYWAAHIGSGHTRNHKRSIGIEIINEGPLKMMADGNLAWWPRNFTTPFCRVDETSRYVQHPWRGYDFWAAYPEEQIAATAELVAYLCARFSIPKELAPPVMRQNFRPQFFGSFSGVAGHQDFRKDKTDPGMALQLERMVQ